MQIRQGVNLNIIKTNKFKTVRFTVRFRAPLSIKTVSKRVIISNLWETSNEVYRTNRDFDLKLSSMYGANFATSVRKKGRDHFLSLNLNIVDPDLLGDENLLEEAIDFIKAVIFKPLLDQEVRQSFDAATFSREQKNLVRYLESTVEDKAYYASQKLNDLYFQDEDMRLSSISNAELLQQENSIDTYSYYQEMLAKEAIDIVIVGDVDENKVYDLFKNLPFKEREPEKTSIFYEQKNMALKKQEEIKDANQSVLNMAYNLPISYGTKLYPALQVFNGLFGGFPHSKLFLNVREREGLAYYASSSFDSFAGLVRVKSGIDAVNKDKVIDLISEQLESLRKGDFSDEDLAQTKRMLTNAYKLAQDSVGNLLEQKLLEDLLGKRYMVEESWLQAVNKVTKSDVMQVANCINLNAIYFLKGESHGED